MPLTRDEANQVCHQEANQGSLLFMGVPAVIAAPAGPVASVVAGSVGAMGAAATHHDRYSNCMNRHGFEPDSRHKPSISISCNIL